jgi:hypothetical protein
MQCDNLIKLSKSVLHESQRFREQSPSLELQGQAVAQLVEALRYKPEDRGIESR